MFEDDVFIENTRLVGGSKTQDLNLRADVVLDMSRGSPGQWFPETEYWASAIFVGTSGIPPKIIYRSVKSYTLLPLSRGESFFSFSHASSPFPLETSGSFFNFNSFLFIYLFIFLNLIFYLFIRSLQFVDI